MDKKLFNPGILAVCIIGLVFLTGFRDENDQHSGSHNGGGHDQHIEKEGTDHDNDQHGHGDEHNQEESESAHETPHGGIVKMIGDYHLELTYDEKNGEIAVYVLGSKETINVPIDAKPLKVRVKIEDSDELTDIELRAVPLDGEPKGKSSRFVGSHYELVKVKSFDVTVQVSILGKVYQTRYQVIPDDLRTVYVCSMGCEKGKVYYEPGRCPICGMDLVKPTEAHADHSSKHGGIVFMAPNKWHHIEGVMSSANEFRVYLYNNFTKPISAELYVEGSYVEIVQLDQEGKEIGMPMKQPLILAIDNSYLTVSIPEGVSFPLAVNVWIKFDPKKPDLFGFIFEKISDTEGGHDDHSDHDGE